MQLAAVLLNVWVLLLAETRALALVGGKEAPTNPEEQAKEEEKAEKIAKALEARARLQDQLNAASNRSSVAAKAIEAIEAELAASFANRTKAVVSYNSTDKPPMDMELQALKNEYDALLAECGSGQFVGSSGATRERIMRDMANYRAKAVLRGVDLPGDWKDAGRSAMDAQKHDVKCPEGSVMSAWRFSTARWPRAKFPGTCTRGMKMGQCTRHSTSQNDGGGGNMFYWDRHTIRCPTGTALQGWKLNGGSKINFDYTCCEVPNIASNTYYRTPTQDGGPNGHVEGHFRYLDRHRPSCPAGMAMTGWDLRPSFLQEAKPEAQTLSETEPCSENATLSENATDLAADPLDTEGSGRPRKAEPEEQRVVARRARSPLRVLTASEADTWASSATSSQGAWPWWRKPDPPHGQYRYAGGCWEEHREGWDGEERRECFNQGMQCGHHHVRRGHSCVYSPPPPPPRRLHINFWCASIANTESSLLAERANVTAASAVSVVGSAASSTAASGSGSLRGTQSHGQAGKPGTVQNAKDPDLMKILEANSDMMTSIETAGFNANNLENRLRTLQAELERSKLSAKMLDHLSSKATLTYAKRKAQLEAEITTLKHKCEHIEAMKKAGPKIEEVMAKANAQKFTR